MDERGFVQAVMENIQKIDFIGLAIGIGLIVFHKKIAKGIFREQIERFRTEDKETLEKTEEKTGFDISGFLRKIIEVCGLIFGSFLVLFSIDKLFSEETRQFISWFFAFVVLTPISAGFAALLTFLPVWLLEKRKNPRDKLEGLRFLIVGGSLKKAIDHFGPNKTDENTLLQRKYVKIKLSLLAIYFITWFSFFMWLFYYVIGNVG